MGETEGQRVRGRKEEKQQGEGDERRNAGWSGAEGEREEGEVERRSPGPRSPVTHSLPRLVPGEQEASLVFVF